jgi:predicted DNA-binding transcriptional regulator YafY
LSRGDAFIRQLKLLQLLESRSSGLEIDEAADALHTGRRTVYRDFEVLEQSGIPLVAEHEGKRARWRMMDGYRHRLQIALTWSEVLALSTGGRLLAGLSGTLFHEGAVSALEKIRATLPKALASRVRATEANVSAASDGHDYRARGDLLRRLTEAIEQRRTIVARYRSRTRTPARAQTRRLDPYHLRVSEHALYVIAFCHRTDTPKTFLLDRFDSLELTDARFEIAPHFDPEQFLSPTFGMWSGPVKTVRFVVAPPLADLLMERKVHPSQVTQRLSDGSAEVRLQCAVGPPLVAYLAGLGDAVSHVWPLSLERDLESHLRKAIERLT